MALISDNNQKNKLKNYNINIKTKYIVGSKILERNTNDSYNDDIENGIRCEKNYYVNDNLVHTEDKFDSRIEYTFIFPKQENEEYTCPNCGHHANVKEFVDGCPYCGTYYNMDYVQKDLGGKYHYDRILRSTKYRIITAIVDLILSLIAAYIFIIKTSRTFNFYDISKIFIYGTILALILYYFFYVIDVYIVLAPIKKYKDIQNSKQKEFWNKTQIDKKKFFNNLNYAIRKKYYSQDNIIDYDILDYDEFKDKTTNKNICVEVKAYVRIVTYVNHKISSKYLVDTFVMEKNNNELLKLEEGKNIIKCPNCGASIDATKEECEYCNYKIKSLQEWIMK